MPTGYYTAPILEGDGITFERFAMRCARAFGALVNMREDSMDAEIPRTFDPSTYNSDGEKAQRAELARLDAMDADARTEFGREARDAARKRCRESIARNKANKARLDEMTTRVLAWVPPSPDHQEMKTFMLEQITETLKWDGSDKHEQEELARLEKKDLREYWQDSRAVTVRSIEYHVENQRSENERAAMRTKWVAQLRESLKATRNDPSKPREADRAGGRQ